MAVFERKGNRFLLDGNEFRILSGTMHYFRVHPGLWRDRLGKMKALGLNTLETYMPWNLHEPRPGIFDFSGMLDVERYLGMAAESGLRVLLRPCPYICSEWDFGALPSWLITIPGMRIRADSAPFLDALQRYYDRILPMVEPFSCRNGGPVVGVQVENEYGAFGNDSEYLERLSDMLERGLPGVMQFTSDNPFPHWLPSGICGDKPCLLNFGSRAEEAWRVLEQVAPGMPHVCAEFWLGWFDHWGEEHHRRDAEEVANVLRDILRDGGHVNLYPFHGGTTFGFLNGANCDAPRKYQPIVNSYDFDAPLSENGAPTPKFAAIRKVLAEFGSGIDPDSPLPEAPPVRAYGDVKLTEYAALSDNLNALAVPIRSPWPPSMEEAGQNFGFIHYRTVIPRVPSDEDIIIDEPRDRAQVFLNGKPVGTVYCNDESHGVRAGFAPGDVLDILVENMGRANYGPYMQRNARKGVSDCVRIGNQALCGWEVWPLPLEDLSGLKFGSEHPAEGIPAFYRGYLEVDAPADTFLKIPGGKGVAFINGFNLGRYWEIGPAHTLYVPAPLLRRGCNEVVIFELHAMKKDLVSFLDVPQLS